MYSEYIVDKTYSEGIIAEDKIKVLGNLLMSQLVKDMLDKEFGKKYIVSIPDSLFTKEKKLEKIMSMFDDGHAKNSVLFLVSIDIVNDNKKIIRKLLFSALLCIRQNICLTISVLCSNPNLVYIRLW